MSKKDELLEMLAHCTREERLEIFRFLRKEIPIHSLEGQLNTQAEVILEAMARSSDLTMRGIRGIIAEAAFLVEVLQKLDGWKIGNIVGNAAYDFLIEDGIGRVTIQVKMQRREKGIPLVRKHKFVVETQKTRGGRDAAAKTRDHTGSVNSIFLPSLFIRRQMIGRGSHIRSEDGFVPDQMQLTYSTYSSLYHKCQMRIGAKTWKDVLDGFVLEFSAP